MALFASTYFGPIDYYQVLLREEKVWIDSREPWQKQSYRNRCYIDAPNGSLMLNIPIVHNSPKEMGAVEISYAQNWPAQHWQAIRTSYGQAPFWESLSGDVEELLNSRPKLLFELNKRTMTTVLAWLQTELKWSPSEAERPSADYRERFHPKRASGISTSRYPQQFERKHGFREGLSILDLCFNEGPAALGYLYGL